MHHSQQKIVSAIIESLEKGVEPWRTQHKNGTSKRRDGMPYNAISGASYRGFNVIALLMTERPIDGGWLTYKQAVAAGGNVRKGEKSTVIFYYSRAEKKDRGADGKPEYYMLAKSYLVFHFDQCENIDPSKLAAIPTKENYFPADLNGLRCAEADAAIEATKAKIIHRDIDYACYVPSLDVIYIHPIEQYSTKDAYYSTMFHELAHWTGSRLGRNIANHKHSKAYGYEELIAELTACFVLPQFGLDNSFSNKNYLGAWIKMLKENPNVLTSIASQAAKAADFINAFSGATEEAGEDEIEQAA